uniref:Uncharacterized protein n=1 Tax=Setaria italica TaxID=4555 RepID=K3XSF6_SETIT
MSLLILIYNHFHITQSAAPLAIIDRQFFLLSILSQVSLICCRSSDASGWLTGFIFPSRHNCWLYIGRQACMI